MFDYKKYRQSQLEILRTNSILNMLPDGCKTVLEIGSRDGYFTKIFSEKYEKVIALDLEYPQIDMENVTPMVGDVTDISLPDNCADLVVCTEVLEHINPELLLKACNELYRVSNKYILIGVPFQQDLRTNATYCSNCDTINPTTGHLSIFDKNKLYSLFPECKINKIELVGRGQYKTNYLSYNIYKRFNFPFGSYEQEEGCVNCGEKIMPPKISLLSEFVCRGAQTLCFIHNNLFINKDKHPLWIHVLFEKENIYDNPKNDNQFNTGY